MNRICFVSALCLVLAACGSSNGNNAQCQPGVNSCAGNEIVSCNSDGSYGAVIQTCANGCQLGACIADVDGGSTGIDSGNVVDDGSSIVADGGNIVGDGGQSCAPGASNVIYVLDIDETLYSFDPKTLSFTSIGNLGCPAAPPLDGSQYPTPFSMAVDRSATAWVLYNSGEIFDVSTKDASCTATKFQPSQSGLDLFGMGFVSDGAGSNTEKLYIGGGALGINGIENQKLATIDTSTLKVAAIAGLNNTQNAPEFTGTADGKLYGLFPAMTTYIAQVNKTTAAISSTHWTVATVTGFNKPNDVAFAQFGGKFYVFFTYKNGIGSLVSEVVLVDPAANGGAGSHTVVQTNNVPHVVGAGVSTCAPVID